MGNVMIKLQIVSDVSCPWCAIGYHALDQAIAKLPSSVIIELSWLPFEINPGMCKEGQGVNEYLASKYGMSDEQQLQNIAQIEQRGLDVGFEFKPLVERHIYNSFDCHLLLHLAQTLDLQTPLKSALFDAYFKQGYDISDRQVLTKVGLAVGVTNEQIQAALNDEALAQQVREQMTEIKQLGINSVPTLIINQQYAITGAQTPEQYVDIITQVIESA